MFGKYENMIWKNISLYNVGTRDKDDVFQDSLVLLNKAITIFNESKGKTFTRYFELILKREIIHKVNRMPKHILIDKPELLPGYSIIEEEIDFDFNLKTKLEKDVFNLYFIEKRKISFVASSLEMEEKQVYNCIYRIKKKIKDLL